MVSRRPISGVTIMPVPKLDIISKNDTCISVSLTVFVNPKGGGCTLGNPGGTCPIRVRGESPAIENKISL